MEPHTGGVVDGDLGTGGGIGAGDGERLVCRERFFVPEHADVVAGIRGFPEAVVIGVVCDDDPGDHVCKRCVRADLGEQGSAEIVLDDAVHRFVEQ